MKATDQLGTKASSDGYNKTQLNVDQDMERHVFHRDRLAHYYRWAHITRAAKHGDRVVDLGCGTGALATMLYANRHDPGAYVGVDIRSKALDKSNEYFSQRGPFKFLAADLCKDGWVEDVKASLKWLEETKSGWMFQQPGPELICSFEFMEHIPGDQVEPWLLRVKQLMQPHTKFYLSTPCFDGVRKAENHIKEWYYQELGDLLLKHFRIEDHWGTFMSQKDLEKALAAQPVGKATEMQATWDRLRSYYGSEPMAIVYAPLFPEFARNCLWKLTLPEVK